MKLTKKQRAELRMMFGGRCAYCGCELAEKGWHADHIEAVHRISEIDQKAKSAGKFRLRYSGEMNLPDNDNVENQRPACAQCNINKSTLDVESFRKFIATRNAAIMKTPAGKLSMKYGMCQLTDKPVVFWFEQYQQQEEA